MDDSKIISLLHERSEQGIKELSEKYGKLCLKIAVNILNNTEDSKECINDAYLAVWNTVPPENPQPFKTYLLKIVRNCALKKYHYMSAVKRNSHYDTALEELQSILSSEDSVEDEISLNELIQAVNTFLGTLPKENRVFFVRRYYYGDSVKDIAAAGGFSPHYVSVKLSRIREHLKKYLMKEGLI